MPFNVSKIANILTEETIKNLQLDLCEEEKFLNTLKRKKKQEIILIIKKIVDQFKFINTNSQEFLKRILFSQEYFDYEGLVINAFNDKNFKLYSRKLYEIFQEKILSIFKEYADYFYSVVFNQETNRDNVYLNIYPIIVQKNILFLLKYVEEEENFRKSFNNLPWKQELKKIYGVNAEKTRKNMEILVKKTRDWMLEFSQGSRIKNCKIPDFFQEELEEFFRDLIINKERNPSVLIEKSPLISSLNNIYPDLLRKVLKNFKKQEKKIQNVFFNGFFLINESFFYDLDRNIEILITNLCKKESLKSYSSIIKNIFKEIFTYSEETAIIMEKYPIILNSNSKELFKNTKKSQRIYEFKKKYKNIFNVGFIVCFLIFTIIGFFSLSILENKRTKIFFSVSGFFLLSFLINIFLTREQIFDFNKESQLKNLRINL